MAAPRSVYRRRGPQDKKSRPNRVHLGTHETDVENRDTQRSDPLLETDQVPKAEDPMDNVEAGEDG
jgi:hypothetical protein